MDARNKAAKFIVLSGLAYLAVLAVAGELRLSSRALKFFAILWLVQASTALWRAWRHPQSVKSADTSTTGDFPPAG